MDSGDGDMSAEHRERYRGFRIVAARALNGRWQAKIEGIGALSNHHSTAWAAVNEIKQYIDEQVTERWSPGV
jgi:hypothetical protein